MKGRQKCKETRRKVDRNVGTGRETEKKVERKAKKRETGGETKSKKTRTSV